jgi:hypothetical protein
MGPWYTTEGGCAGQRSKRAETTNDARGRAQTLLPSAKPGAVSHLARAFNNGQMGGIWIRAAWDAGTKLRRGVASNGEVGMRIRRWRR